jgi:hypothetical protein
MLSLLNGSFVDEVIVHPLLNISLDRPSLPACFAVLDEPVQGMLHSAIRACALPDFVDIAPVRHSQRSFVENSAIVENLLITC